MTSNNTSKEKSKITFWSEIGKNTWLYMILAITFAISFIVSLLVNIDVIAKTIIALPGGAAAVGLIIQIIRDNESHKRELEKQKNDHGFSLAFTSYLSEYTFNKYTEFCEKYLKKLREVPIKEDNAGYCVAKFEDFANELTTVRENYRLWLKSDVDDDLKKLEDKFRKATEAYNDFSNNQDKTKNIDLAKTFIERLAFAFALDPDFELEPNNCNSSSNLHLNNVIERLRQILHIDDIYNLRQEHFKKLGK